MRTHSLLWTVGTVTCITFLASGCASEGAPKSDPSTDRDPVATLRLAFTASSAGALSVRIDGTRRTDADGKYPCTSHFEGTCIDFSDPALATSSNVQGIAGLCPSADVGASPADSTPSPWDFKITLFSAQGCGGTPLTGGDTPSIVCYGAASVGVAGTEDRILGEMLVPGENGTQVFCLTKPPG